MDTNDNQPTPAAPIKPVRKQRLHHKGLKITAEFLCVCESSDRKIHEPAACYAELADLGQLAQEAFVVLTLNTRNRLIKRHLCSLGLLDSSPVHPREVFRAAIMDGAAAVILGHGHPSGDPTPSVEDLRVTRQLVEASRILGIRVIDHLIIGRPTDTSPGYISLREKGLVSFDGV